MPTAETSGELTEDPVSGAPPVKYPEGNNHQSLIYLYILPEGEKEDELSTELTLDELKAAFRYKHLICLFHCY